MTVDYLWYHLSDDWSGFLFKLHVVFHGKNKICAMILFREIFNLKFSASKLVDVQSSRKDLIYFINPKTIGV